jgi:Cys-tRNA(Pro) deacylase
MKPNAVRLLEEMGLAHELRAYEVDPDDLAAQAVADKIGLPAEQVFKTLVARGDRHGVCFAVVPGNVRLDLKALARLTGDRKVETVPLKEVQPLTGYVRGGVTVLGAKRAYVTVTHGEPGGQFFSRKTIGHRYLESNQQIGKVVVTVWRRRQWLRRARRGRRGPLKAVCRTNGTWISPSLWVKRT